MPAVRASTVAPEPEFIQLHCSVFSPRAVLLDLPLRALCGPAWRELSRGLLRGRLCHLAGCCLGILSDCVRFADLMSDDKDSGYGCWSKVPVWDGSPMTWRAFKRETSWWLSSWDLEGTKKVQLLRQSGTVRQRGEEFTPDDLKYQPAITHKDLETGEIMTLTLEDPLGGINKLMRHQQVDEWARGDDWSYLPGQAWRAPFSVLLELGPEARERVADFATRCRTSIADMKAEGIVLPDGELGWWLKEKVGLDPLWKQLLETALAGSESFNVIEGELLWLFRDLRLQDPLYRKLERQ